MNLFYAPEVTLNLTEYILPKEESKHLLVSRRTKQGDDFFITDGQGQIFKSVIQEITKSNVIINNIELFETQEQNIVSLAICPTKMMRKIELVVEKAVEIGCKEIIVFYSNNTERKTTNIHRLQRIAISAMKQSLHAWLPNIIEIDDLTALLEYYKGDKYIAHCYSGTDKIKISDVKSKEELLVMIGPEGDFSKAEVEQSLKAKCKAVSLGNTRLRTETAALVAMAVINN